MTAVVIQFPRRERNSWAEPQAKDYRIAAGAWLGAFAIGVTFWAAIFVTVCSWGLL